MLCVTALLWCRYCLIYVAKTPGHPQHEAVCDEFKRLLARGVRAILVSERSEETAACGMMEKRGAHWRYGTCAC